MGAYARDIMIAEVVCVREDMTLQQLAQQLQEHDITGAPVLDETGTLVGVVSAMDIILKNETLAERPVTDSDYHKETNTEGGYLWDDFGLEDMGDRRVRDIMSPEVVTARPETPIEELAGIMYSHRIHRVIIVEEDRLCGIVSTVDILKAVMEGKVT